MPQTQWSPALHKMIFQEKTSTGQWSKKLHDYKHKNCQNTYEDQVQDFINTQGLSSYNQPLQYDLFTAPFGPVSEQPTGDVGEQVRPLLDPRLGLHIQTGGQRASMPWLPPFLRSPPSSTLSPRVFGVAGCSPKGLERTGGGYMERQQKQAGHSGLCKHNMWGPQLVNGSKTTKFKQLNPDRTKPSLAERALWVHSADGKRFATNMGMNYRDRCDNPREPLHLTRSEAECLFDKNTMPLTPDLRKARVIASPGPSIRRGFPVRRPFTSQDLYRLSQFCCSERASPL